MGITVRGPDGATVEFPDGTNATTIDRVMRERSGPAPGMGESLLRGIGEGATLGLGDEIGLLSRERQEASRRANPWTHFVGEMIGTVAPAVVATPVAAGRLGTGLLARGARALATPFAAGDMTTLAGSIGQGLKMGAAYGAVSGAGHVDTAPGASWTDALMQRTGGALAGGLVGGAFGGPTGALTYPLGRAAQAIGGARAAANLETSGPGAGAMTALSRALERDHITPQQLIDNILSEFPSPTATAAGGMARRYWGPASARQPWTQEMVEEVVRRALVGEDSASIVAAMAPRFGGRGPGRKAVQTLLDELAERHNVPLNLVDRAKLIRPGSGENVGWTLRAASATPGEARSTAREALVERQIGQGQRLSSAITNHIGTPDFDGRLAQLARDIATQNDALYGAAHQLDAQMIALGRTVGDVIEPVLTAHGVKWEFSRGPVADAIGRAVAAFRPGVSPGDAARRMGTALDRPIGSLEEFMQANMNLQALFDEFRGNPTVMRALMQFKTDLYDAVGTHNSLWRVANDAAADGFAAQRALNLGMEYASRLGPQTRDQLRLFHDMSEPEKELYRIGVAQRLHERIMNREATHDLTSELRLPATRQTLRTILGYERANKLFARVEREFATTRTYREQFGSQTTPLREAIDDLSWAPRMESATQLLNPAKIVEQTMVWLAKNINEGRNRELLTMLTNANPVEQLNILRSLAPLHAARSAAGRQTGVIATGFGGVSLPSALMGVLADLNRQQR